jgi:hypothetical protein
VRVHFGAARVRHLDVHALQRPHLALGEQVGTAVVELLDGVVGGLARGLGGRLDEAAGQDVAARGLDLLDDLGILVQLGGDGLLGDDLLVDQVVEHLLGGRVARVGTHAALLLQGDRQLSGGQFVAVDLGDDLAARAVGAADVLLLAAGRYEENGQGGRDSDGHAGAAGLGYGTLHRREPLGARWDRNILPDRDDRPAAAALNRSL